MSNKKTSKSVASQAAKTLGNKSASKVQKSIAASVLAQSGTNKTTSERVEKLASSALKNKNSAKLTKTFAASAMSQSTKKKGEK